MEIWIATSNKGKLREFENLLKQKFEIHTQLDLTYYTPPEENGKSFEENARIKAKALKSVLPDKWVLGEDSGLEVEGLNNFPGVHSARYAGPHARPNENTAKVLKMLQIRNPNKREAQFCSIIVVIDPQGNESIFNGTLKGSIALKQRGSDGFGYDDIFIPEGFTQTIAELGIAKKNQLSHRALAIKNFLETLNH